MGTLGLGGLSACSPLCLLSFCLTLLPPHTFLFLPPCYVVVVLRLLCYIVFYCVILQLCSLLPSPHILFSFIFSGGHVLGGPSFSHASASLAPHGPPVLSSCSHVSPHSWFISFGLHCTGRGASLLLSSALTFSPLPALPTSLHLASPAHLCLLEHSYLLSPLPLRFGRGFAVCRSFGARFAIVGSTFAYAHFVCRFRCVCVCARLLPFCAVVRRILRLLQVEEGGPLTYSGAPLGLQEGKLQLATFPCMTCGVAATSLASLSHLCPPSDRGGGNLLLPLFYLHHTSSSSVLRTLYTYAFYWHTFAFAWFMGGVCSVPFPFVCGKEEGHLLHSSHCTHLFTFMCRTSPLHQGRTLHLTMVDTIHHCAHSLHVHFTEPFGYLPFTHLHTPGCHTTFYTCISIHVEVCGSFMPHCTHSTIHLHTGGEWPFPHVHLPT